MDRRAGGVPSRGPRLAGEPRTRPALAAVARHGGGVRGPPCVGGRVGRGSLVGRLVARGVRWTRCRHPRVAGLRRGVLAGPGTSAGEPERGLPARPDHVRIRYRRPEGPVPAPHGLGPGDLVPGMVRARRRQRPGRHPQPGPAIGVRGGLGPERSEDLGVARGLRRVVLRPLPHGSRRRASSGAHLLPDRPGHPGRHRPTDPPDRRRDGLRGAVLRGRVRPRRPRPG